VTHPNGQDLKRSPTLLVDVDGVISLFGFEPGARPPGRFAVVDGLPHYLSEHAGLLLARLADTFECVWCTGWEDRAPEHLPHLFGWDLPAFPHLRFDGSPGGDGRHWKLAAIDDHVGPERAVAWIDDDLGPRAEAWAAGRPGPTLLVTTDPAVGLIDPHAEELEAWARGLPR
jgi:hypothetical protein